MTFREKYIKEHPGCEEDFMLRRCPYGVGYEREQDSPCGAISKYYNNCEKCWNREMPVPVEKAQLRFLGNTLGRVAMGIKPTIVKVIFNDPATIIFWVDGTKTVVKASGEPFDPEKGMAMAIAKRYLGDDFYELIKKWCKPYIKDLVDNKDCSMCKFSQIYAPLTCAACGIIDNFRNEHHSSFVRKKD